MSLQYPTISPKPSSPSYYPSPTFKNIFYSITNKPHITKTIINTPFNFFLISCIELSIFLSQSNGHKNYAPAYIFLLLFLSQLLSCHGLLLSLLSPLYFPTLLVCLNLVFLIDLYPMISMKILSFHLKLPWILIDWVCSPYDFS